MVTEVSLHPSSECVFPVIEQHRFLNYSYVLDMRLNRIIYLSFCISSEVTG